MLRCARVGVPMYVCMYVCKYVCMYVFNVTSAPLPRGVLTIVVPTIYIDTIYIYTLLSLCTMYVWMYVCIYVCINKLIFGGMLICVYQDYVEGHPRGNRRAKPICSHEDIADNVRRTHRLFAFRQTLQNVRL